MENHKEHKLDNLFRERFHEDEFAPAEDYWPYVEKSLWKVSFYKFGWKHFNIYNLALGIVIFSVPVVYFINRSSDTKEPQSNTSLPIISTPSISHDSVLLVPENEQNDSKAPLNSALSKENNIPKVDSILTEKGSVAETLNTKPNPMEVDPLKSNTLKEQENKEEVKPKQKKIIYVVQQDTIIEKDTIKIKRKRKK